MESNDKKFIRMVSRLEDATTKPERYQLMCEFLAVWSAADDSAPPSAPTQTADVHGASVRIMLDYLTRLATDLQAGAQPPGVADTVASTLTKAAAGLKFIAETMGLASSSLSDPGLIGNVADELATAGKAIRVVVDAWRGSQVPAEPSGDGG